MPGKSNSSSTHGGTIKSAMTSHGGGASSDTSNTSCKRLWMAATNEYIPDDHTHSRHSLGTKQTTRVDKNPFDSNQESDATVTGPGLTDRVIEYDVKCPLMREQTTQHEANSLHESDQECDDLVADLDFSCDELETRLKLPAEKPKNKGLQKMQDDQQEKTDNEQEPADNNKKVNESPQKHKMVPSSVASSAKVNVKDADPHHGRCLITNYDQPEKTVISSWHAPMDNDDFTFVPNQQIIAQVHTWTTLKTPWDTKKRNPISDGINIKICSVEPKLDDSTKLGDSKTPDDFTIQGDSKTPDNSKKLGVSRKLRAFKYYILPLSKGMELVPIHRRRGDSIGPLLSHKLEVYEAWEAKILPTLVFGHEGDKEAVTAGNKQSLQSIKDIYVAWTDQHWCPNQDVRGARGCYVPRVPTRNPTSHNVVLNFRDEFGDSDIMGFTL
ncbi:hypothetical protein B0H10DRAFT_2349238 [Mycena sp. CBHHK59/15]|nr:hypothetical protein B0H10DRAFT_2349238 [Mycena sp. CBHHK59/15]